MRGPGVGDRRIRADAIQERKRMKPSAEQIGTGRRPTPDSHDHTATVGSVAARLELPRHLRPPLLKVGLKHVQTVRVELAMTVTAMAGLYGGFAGMPPVFATAFMVAFLEWTCLEALQPYLEDGQTTVGTHISVSQVAPPPVGLAVTAEVELTRIEGRRLRFRVARRDGAGPIGEGIHERTIIDHHGFLARAAAKQRVTEHV
jgi:fluoroacetyl-CoA thioesterase